MRWRKVSLIGVGLLGGSLGLCLKQRGLAERVEGYVRRAESISECAQLNLVDRASTDLPSVVKGADLVVLCTPLAQMGELSKCALPHIAPGALVTDVGSVKAPLVKELEPIFASRGIEFVGSHPMAGSEKMGAVAAKIDLFEGAVCVVTPHEKNSPEGISKIKSFWLDLGCRILELVPDLHDQLVSRSSHLPHVTAAALVNFVLDPKHPKEQALLCANGFRDSTRIASGSPEMWRDIAISNREQLGPMLRELLGRLEGFTSALEGNDSAEIERFFKAAKTLRDGWVQTGSTRSPE